MNCKSWPAHLLRQIWAITIPKTGNMFFINNFLEQRNGGRNQDSNSIFNVIPCFDPSVTSDHAANHLLYHKLHTQVDVYIQYPGWPRDPFLIKLTRYKTKNNIFYINNKHMHITRSNKAKNTWVKHGHWKPPRNKDTQTHYLFTHSSNRGKTYNKV